MDEQQYYDLMEKLEEIDRKFEEYNGRISKLEWESLKKAAKDSEEKEEMPEEKKVRVKTEIKKSKLATGKTEGFNIGETLLQTGLTLCFLGVVFFVTMGMQNTLNQVIAIVAFGLLFVAASFGYQWASKKSS